MSTLGLPREESHYSNFKKQNVIKWQLNKFCQKVTLLLLKVLAPLINWFLTLKIFEHLFVPDTSGNKKINLFMLSVMIYWVPSTCQILFWCWGFYSFPHVAYSPGRVRQSEMTTQVDNCNFHMCLKGEAHRAVSAHYHGFDSQVRFPKESDAKVEFWWINRGRWTKREGKSILGTGNNTFKSPVVGGNMWHSGAVRLVWFEWSQRVRGCWKR